MSNVIKDLYICDPIHNLECPKTFCHWVDSKHGCRCTTNPDYMVNPKHTNPLDIKYFLESVANTSETILFRYYVDTPANGFWFHANGERNPEAPEDIPMEIIPTRHGRGYMACATSPEQQILYCDEEWDRQHGGTFGIFKIHEKFTDEVSDQVATYRIAKRDKALLIAEFCYEDLRRLLELRQDEK